MQNGFKEVNLDFSFTFTSFSCCNLQCKVSLRNSSGLKSLRNKDTALAPNSSSLAKGRDRGWIRTLLALYPVQASPEFHDIYAEVMSRCGGRGSS
jgi:hypothetical protein